MADQYQVSDFAKTLRGIDEYLRFNVIQNREERDVFISVVKQLLAERCAYGELKRKALYHARSGDVGQTKRVLARLGIHPNRIDAILPLIRG